MNDIQQQDRTIDGISTIELCLEPTDKIAPLVIFQHGFGCDKTNHLDEARQIAAMGFRVVLPDAYLHGDHAQSEWEEISPFKKAEQMDEIYTRTSENIHKLITYYEENRKNFRVGLVGVSMGGCAVLHHLTHKPHRRVKAAAVLIASPYWENHLQQCSVMIPETGSFLSETVFEKIRQNEPSRFLSNIKDIPLLFQNGVADLFVPIADVQHTVAELKTIYNHPNRVKLIAYEGIEHEVLPEMVNQAGDWLEVYLKKI